MRFSDVFTASLVVPLIAAHGDHHFHAAPKIIGLPRSDIGGLKNRNILGGHEARVVRPHQDSKLTARQVGGNADGRCGKDFGCATCNTGYCCSVAGYCGTGPDFCQSPDCNFEYGPACDANKVPTGGSTRNTPRTKLGSQTYGGEGIYSCVNPGEVAITYDDGPYTYTDELLNLLATKGAKATFFVTGINLSKGAIDTTSAWSNVIKRMVSEKHQVASHTWSHQDLSAITSAQRYDQMVRNEMALSNILGKFPTYMRPPYSSCTAASGCQKDLADLGYVVSYFDLDTDDYNQLTTTKIQVAKDNVVKGFAGTNPANDNRQLIAHDIHQLTAQDLSTYMVNYIDSLGYKMVTLGQCMGEPEANWYRTPSARTASTSSFAAPTACSSGASSSRVSTSAAATSTPSGVSTDGMCGSTAGKTCLNSGLGECCSQYGWCGATTDHCGTGCQAGFGQCGSLSSSSTLLSTGTARSSSAVVSSTVRSSTVGASSTKASSSASSTKAASSVSSTKASSTAGVSSTRAASSAAASASTVAKVSTDGTCGGTNGYTCAGFSEGECCSSYGWCGSSTGHCGTGCNPLFGKCTSSGTPSSAAKASSVAAAASSSKAASSTIIASTAKATSSTKAASSTKASSATPSPTPVKKVSTNGTCGGSTGFTCLKSGYGNCCSVAGWCGSSTAHCRKTVGCQAAFGTCT